MRAHALATRGTTQLDFATEVEPLIRAEAQAAYETCARRLGSAVPPLRLDAVAQPLVSGLLTRVPTGSRM